MNDSSMRMLRLHLLLEEVKSDNCGVAMLQLALKYYGCDGNLTIRDYNSERGPWMIDLAEAAARHGCKTRLFCYSTTMFRPSWFQFTARDNLALLNMLDTPIEDPVLHEVYSSLQKYISAGFDFQFRITTPKDIQDAIENDEMMLLSVESRSFHLDDTGNGGHYCLVESVGFNNATVLSLGSLGIMSISMPLERLLFANYRWGGWSLYINRQ